MIPENLPKTENNIEKKEGIGPKRIFVEIGNGFSSVARVGGLEFKDNNYYVGVDLGQKDHSKGVSSKNVFFVEAKGQNLPFENSSVDEIFLGNVLGDPDIHTDVLGSILSQAKRALKKGGVLIILETYTPRRDLGYRTVDYVLGHRGFKKIREVKFGDPDFKQEMDKYYGPSLPHMLQDREFISFFEKQ